MRKPTSRAAMLVLGSCVARSAAFSSINRISGVVHIRRASTVLSLSSSSTSSSRGINPFSLKGKTALITGSSGGIGKGIAKTFAEAGADVIVHYHTRYDGAVGTFKEINDHYESSGCINGDSPGRCLGIIKADFRSPQAVSEMFHYVTNDILKDSRLDIVVNNAGIVTKLAVEDDDDNLSSWHETMSVNLHAPVQLMKLAHAHMKSKTSQQRKGGVIINNTSIHGSRSVEYMTAYAATKAALDSLTRGLACEYAVDGVRVNAIAPGVVPVERTAAPFSDPNVVDMWTPHLPVGRLGTVEDIAQATLVLATNEWMSGTVLTVGEFQVVAIALYVNRALNLRTVDFRWWNDGTRKYADKT